MRMLFYVSTAAFRKLPLEEGLSLARANRMNLEFSSGIPYRKDLKDLYLAWDGTKLPHNYFPAPEVPFVLNLASADTETFQKSVEHCRQGIELSKAGGAPFFSVHAGFCVDPKPHELGKEFKATSPWTRAQHWERFVGAVTELSSYAGSHGVGLLIENNVVIRSNVKEGAQPLLCSDIAETLDLCQSIKNQSFGILVDTGHLKVSAETLGFDRDDWIEAVGPYVKAFHHSDNDGMADTNQPLREDYWFLKHMPRFGNKAHVLEVLDLTLEQIHFQRDLLAKAAGLKHVGTL